MVGANLTNIQCKATQKCHNEFPPVQLMYTNKNEKKKKKKEALPRIFA
jgi:hypothetical protein